MNAQEMIAKLSAASPNAKVSVYDPRYYLISDIDYVDIEDDGSVTIVSKLRG